MPFNKKTILITILSILILGGLFCFVYFKKSVKIVSRNTEGVESVENDKNVQVVQATKSVDGDINNKKAKSVENVQNVEDVKDEKKVESDKTKMVSQNSVIDNSGEIKIKNKLVNWGFTESSGRKIDTIILHSSYDALGDNPYDLEGLIAEYKQYGVAPHYLIDRKGKVYRLVADKNIAWHAGAGQTPDGRKNVNNFSIGVEIMNTKTDNYTKKQYQATQDLIDYLKKKYKINYILGHNEIAPGRKTDPWNFEWDKIRK